MKKILLVVLLLLLAPKISNAVSAEAYVVMDYDTGRILSSKNPEKEKLIASTTNIMTT